MKMDVLVDCQTTFGEGPLRDVDEAAAVLGSFQRPSIPESSAMISEQPPGVVELDAAVNEEPPQRRPARA